MGILGACDEQASGTKVIIAGAKGIYSGTNFAEQLAHGRGKTIALSGIQARVLLMRI